MRSRSNLAVRGLRLRRVLSAAIALVLGAALPVAAGSTASADAAAHRVDNPYAHAGGVYVNPEWSAKAAAEPGGSPVAHQPTFVWLDSIASVHGTDGRLGLRGHLDAALRQAGGRRGFVVQVVLHDLPGRECVHSGQEGELGPDDLDAYKSEYVDPIAAVLGDPKYAALRIVTVVEPGSLLGLVTGTGTDTRQRALCLTMRDNGNYVNGIGYALARLGAVANVYNYLDAGQHADVGWPTSTGAYVQLLLQAATSSGSTFGDVQGIIADTADYFVPHEPYFTIDDIVNGAPVYRSRWVDWSTYVDEVPFVLGLRTELVGAGFADDIGALVDTSRSGWGGPARPTGPGPKTSVDAYVDGSRTDRRLYYWNWCNQAGAGLGERPATAPSPGIDAYVWAKPPGESDGSAGASSTDPGTAEPDPMCDPDFGGWGGTSRPTGALRGAPAYGEWFPTAFQQLVQNAYPPLTG